MQLTKKCGWNVVLIILITCFNLLTVSILISDYSGAKQTIFPIPDGIVLHHGKTSIEIYAGNIPFDDIIYLNESRNNIIEYYKNVMDDGNMLIDEYYMEYMYENPVEISLIMQNEVKTYSVSSICYVLTGELNGCFRLVAESGDIIASVGILNTDVELIELCSGLLS